MRRAALLNPFNALPDTATATTDAPTRLVHRSTPVCSNCDSEDIVSHATMQWSNELQEWQLTSTFGQPTRCNHCNSACRIKWLVLN